MKNFIDKILGAKYTGYIALVLAIAIVILAVYLISAQYKDSKNVSIYVENTDTSTKVEDKKDESAVKEESKPAEEIKKDDEEKEEKNDDKKEEKVSFANELDIILKGNKVGYAYKVDETVYNSYDKVKYYMQEKGKSNVTTDSVLSIDVSTLNSVTKDSIKEIVGAIYSKDGKELFNSKLYNKYDRISLAVDTLDKSEEYYGAISITTKDNTKIDYVFGF